MKKHFEFIPFILFIFLVIGFTVHLYSKVAPPKDEEESPLVGKSIPAFTMYSLKNNREITNQDIEGDYVLINVFASWCVTCLAEHAFIMNQETQKMIKKHGISLYAVNWSDKRKDALKWLDRYGNPYREVMVDKKNTFLIQMGLVGMPESYLINKKGKILYHKRGALTDASMHKMIEIISAK